MKKITLLLLLILTYSCGIQYDGEKRLIVEGQITDRDEKPLSGRIVEVIVSDYDETDVISNSYTDANGNVLMIFPAPQNADYFSNTRISIRIAGDEIWQGKYLYNMWESDFTNYKYKLNTTLYKKEDIVQFNVIPNRVSNKDLVDVRIEGIQSNESIDFHPIVNDVLYANIQQEFKVIKNQQLVLHYTILNNDNTAPTSYNETINIGNDPINQYTITY